MDSQEERNLDFVALDFDFVASGLETERDGLEVGRLSMRPQLFARRTNAKWTGPPLRGAGKLPRGKPE
jgi:hypothetical protein